VIKRIGWIGLGGGVLAAMICAYALGRARADGVPAIEPLAYGGTLLESGAPVTGTRNIGLTLWTDATSTAGASLACTTTSSPVMVTAGRFRLALDATCVDAVHAHPDLWVELSVGGMALPREHIGAVPYALEAGGGPDYDSGWVPIAHGGYVDLTHGLGAVPRRYTVLVSSMATGEPAFPSGWSWQNAAGEGGRGVIVTNVTSTTLRMAAGTYAGCGVYDDWPSLGTASRHCLPSGYARVLVWR
jgi:hypothetical protein